MRRHADNTLPSTHQNLVCGDAGFGPALDILGRAPFCIQWCVARRKPNQPLEIVVDHHEPVWTDINTLVRAVTKLAYDMTRIEMQQRMASKEPLKLMSLRFFCPTLVVDAPLYTYDVETKTLTTVERLTTFVSADTCQGMRSRLVEVVTADGLDSFLDDVKAAGARMGQKLQPAIRGFLFDAARVQTDRWRHQNGLPPLEVDSQQAGP